VLKLRDDKRERAGEDLNVGGGEADEFAVGEDVQVFLGDKEALRFRDAEFSKGNILLEGHRDGVKYRNLEVITPDPPAANWDELVVQPDPILHDDGFYDALALGAGILVGSQEAGFAVQFDWLGSGEPGPQPFDIVDPVTFQTKYSGTTLPEPSALILLAGAVAAARRQQMRPG
jgi:hypothetical protein